MSAPFTPEQEARLREIIAGMPSAIAAFSLELAALREEFQQGLAELGEHNARTAALLMQVSNAYSLPPRPSPARGHLAKGTPADD